MNNLPTQYQEFIFKSRYAKWLPEQNRRETWPEAVDRYIQHFANQFNLDHETWDELRQSILNLETMPSMRAIMTAGAAAERCNISLYNCAFTAVDAPETFSEIFYILMSGTGVGFSVERQFVSKLPPLHPTLQETDFVIQVPDSREGWADSLACLIDSLYHGEVPTWDVSLVRAAGVPLKTFGGRASGPAPLVDLFRFFIESFAGYYKNGELQGRSQLNSLSVHDLVCKIADVTVSGGVRRSALISLSNLSDERMAKAKVGEWWNSNGQRALANNSVCYTEKPDLNTFMKEWMNLYDSKCGERGIFNRQATKKKFQEIGRDIEGIQEVGVNPCAEINLNKNQLCNLTEIIVRKGDTLDDLKRKARVATILGTLQSSQVDFKYVRQEWSDNCKREALLGVSMTGIMDHEVLSDIHNPEMKTWLSQIRAETKKVNAEWADRIGVNISAAITTVKPSGNVSQLCDTASGLHPRYSKNYIRTVRAGVHDPLAKMMSDLGVPCEPDVMKPDTGLVLSFPVQSEGTIYRDDIDAMYQLNHWKIMQDYYTDHKPSITVYYNDDNFLECGAWLWENFDDVSGISFLPHSDHVYQQAPYQECSLEEVEALEAKMPEIDWDLLSEYEKEDLTTSSKELACSGNKCEI